MTTFVKIDDISDIYKYTGRSFYIAADILSDALDGMTVWPWHKKNAAEITMETIDWMREHTIGDLKEMTIRTEQSGEDVTSLRHLLIDLESMQTELAEAGEQGFSLEDHAYHLSIHELKLAESYSR